MNPSLSWYEPAPLSAGWSERTHHFWILQVRRCQALRIPSPRGYLGARLSTAITIQPESILRWISRSPEGRMGCRSYQVILTAWKRHRGCGSKAWEFISAKTVAGTRARRRSRPVQTSPPCAHHRRTLVSSPCERDDSTGAVYLLTWGYTNGRHKYASLKQPLITSLLRVPGRDSRAGERGLNCYSIHRPLATTENGSATLFAGRPQRFHRFWDFYRHQVLRLLS